MRRRPVEVELPPGVKGGRLPRHLAGGGHTYAKHVGLDWSTQWFQACTERSDAERAWFAERGLTDSHGHIDYRRARALGLYPSTQEN